MHRSKKSYSNITPLNENVGLKVGPELIPIVALAPTLTVAMSPVIFIGPPTTSADTDASVPNLNDNPASENSLFLSKDTKTISCATALKA